MWSYSYLKKVKGIKNICEENKRTVTATGKESNLAKTRTSTWDFKFLRNRMGCHQCTKTMDKRHIQTVIIAEPGAAKYYSKEGI